MAAFLSPLILYVPGFYAGELGLGLATVGLIFGLTKLWDIVTDPILGSVIDRYGPIRHRFRFWLMVSLPLMLVGVHRIFLPPDDVSWVYFASWMLVLYVGWTLLTISHISWGVELSDDYHERSWIAAFRQIAGLIGSLIVVLLPVLTDQFGGGLERMRMSAIGWFVCISLPVLMMLMMQTTPDAMSRVNSQKHRLRDSVLIVWRNRSLRALIFGNMGALLGLAATTSTLLFYVEHVLKLGNWATFAVIPLLFSGMFYLPLWTRLSRQWGKHKAFRTAMLVQILLQPILLIVPEGNLAMTIILFLLIGGIQGCVVFLPQAMIADLKDSEVAEKGSQAGIYVAVLQSTSKVFAALAVGMMFTVLPLTGFDPTSDMVNQEVSQRLRYMITFLPAICYLFGWLCMGGYEIEETEVNFGPEAINRFGK